MGRSTRCLIVLFAFVVAPKTPAQGNAQPNAQGNPQPSAQESAQPSAQEKAQKNAQKKAQPGAADKQPEDLRAALLALPLASARAAASATDTSPAPTPAPTPTPTPTPAPPPTTITVVDPEGRPVAGASVFVHDPERARAHAEPVSPPQPGRPSRSQSPYRDLEHAMLARIWASAARYETDRTGTLTLLQPDPVVMAVIHGDRLGFARRPRRGEPLRIVVHPVLEVACTVVDDQGRPVADLGISFQQGPVGEGLSSGSMGRTGPDGSFQFRVPIALMKMMPAGYVPQVHALVVGARVLAPIETATDGTRASARVVLPPTGQVRVIVYDEREQPRRGAHEVWLTTAEDADARSPGPGVAPHTGFSPTVVDDSGAQFSHVALGQELVATIATEGEDGMRRLQRPGPSRRGELVVFEVRATVGAPRLLGRLLGLDGEPVQGEPLHLVLLGPDPGMPRALPLRTAADGSFALVLPANLRLAETARGMVLRRGTGAAHYGGAAVIEIPPAAAGGVQCGTIRLQQEPVLLGGRVVDTDGRPVPDLELRAPLSHPDPRGQLGAAAHCVRTDAEGRFELRELQPGDALPTIRLHAREDLHIVEQAAAAGDPRDLRLVVARGGSLRVVLPDAPAEGPRFELRRRDGTRADSMFRSAPGGVWTCDRLAPGTYDLQITVLRSELHRIDGLQIRAGEECADPRLAAVPWRERFRVLRLCFEEQDQRPTRAELAVA